MNPAMLPWWGWACITAAAFLAFNSTNNRREKWAFPVNLAAFLLMLFFGFITVIRFIKWVWIA